MNDELKGAWMHRYNNEEHLLQFVDSYYTHSIYNKAEKKFIETRGSRSPRLLAEAPCSGAEEAALVPSRQTYR